MTTPSASQPPAMSDICASCDLPRSVHPTGDCRGFVAGAPLSVDRFGSSVRAGTSEVAASVLSEEAAPPTNALDEDLLGRVRALLAKPPREFVKLERADFARLYELSRLRSLVSQPVADKVIATLKHDGDGFYVTWHEVSHGGIKSRACTGDYDTQRGAIEGYLEEAEQNA